MIELRRTTEFDAWLRTLRDARAKAKVLVRLERLSAGNAGDVAPVGEGISEMRIHYGPGYRVYYRHSGEAVTILLGGSKDMQSTDIARAKALARTIED